MFLKNTWPAILWAVLILVLTLSPEPELPRVKWIYIPHADKIVHSILFGVLYLLMMRGLMKQHELYHRAVLWTMATVILYGALTEILQTILPIGRDGNVMDWVADCIGTAMAYVVYAYRKRQKNVSA